MLIAYNAVYSTQYIYNTVRQYIYIYSIYIYYNSVYLYIRTEDILKMSLLIGHHNKQTPNRAMCSSLNYISF